MCGRLNLSDLDGIRQLMADIGLPLFEDDQQTPQYNVAPTATVNVLVPRGAPTRSLPACQRMQWGMPISNGPLVINARLETLNQKPMFRSIAQQRALVPVSGFYEWQIQKGARHAWHFESADEPAMALAAIWRLVESTPQLVLLTTAADELMTPIHHRMPFAVSTIQALDWLHGMPTSSLSNTKWHRRRVSSWVNDARNQGQDCLRDPEPIPYTPDLFE